MHPPTRGRPRRRDHSTLGGRVFQGAAGGAVVGLLMIGVGIVRAAYALFAGGLGAPSERELGLLAMYVGGFAAAGAVLGALWPLRSTRVGAYMLGYIGAAIVSSVCGRIVMEAEHDHDRGAFVLVVTIMTLVFGTAAGHQIRRED